MRTVLAFVAGFTLAFLIAAPVQSGRPGWFCERKPTHPACQSPGPVTFAPTIVSTVAPTSAPTPAPTTAVARPFPAPVTSRTVQAPTSGDLSAWLDGVGNDVLVEFVPGTYTLSRGFLLQGRDNIVLDGNGATLNLNTPGGNSDPSARASAFMLKDSDDIAIREFTIVGNNPDTDNIFVPGNEGQHVLSLNGWFATGPSSNVEISNVTASHIYADFAYLEGRNGGAFEPSQNVWIHDNAASYIGRNAISSISVNDLLVEDNAFDKIGGAAWDIEPNYAAEQVRRNTFRHNQIGSYGHMRQFVGWFVVAAYVEPTPVDGLVVDDNDVVGNPAAANDGTPRGLNSKFLGEYDNAAGARPTNITFTNNRTAQAAQGPVLYCGPGVRATSSGNVQPLVSGSFTNCLP